MRTFYEEWSMLDATLIAAGQHNLELAGAKSPDSAILAVATAKSSDESFWQLQLPKTSDFPIAEFLKMEFTQHLVVLGKVKAHPKRLFYIRRCAEQQYSVEDLEASIAHDDYGHQGSLPNNFPQTLSAAGQALRAIKPSRPPPP